MIGRIFLLLTICLFSSATFAGDVAVKGYFRSNGTYVKPHYRSAPDGDFSNNWTTAGNINPYTGKLGTRVAPDAGYGKRRQATTPTIARRPHQAEIPEQSIRTVVLPELHEVKEASSIAAALETPTAIKPLQPLSRGTTKPKIETYYSSLTREAQEYLNYLGFDIGPADGLFGSRTRAAVYAYQRTRSLAITGKINEPLLETMSLEIGAQTRRVADQNLPSAVKVELNDRPSGDLVDRTQLYLTILGLYNEGETGVNKSKLEHAIMRFQNSNRISVDGQVTPQLLSSIRSKLYN